MVSLSEFLLARIADDEGAARDAWERKWETAYGMAVWSPLAGRVDHELIAECSSPENGRFIARNHPARVLAECAAKRRIVKRWQSASDYIKVRQAERMPCDAIQRDARVTYESLRDLALPYADHPDYREEWKP